jgi:hypothetical protein
VSERTRYVLTNVVLVEAKVELDQDVHLVIRDEHGKPSDHMISSSRTSSAT